MKKMKLLLVIFSIAITSCAGIPKPQGLACVAFSAKGYSLCYDLSNDFDADGNVVPGAKPSRVPLSLAGINKHIHFDPDSYASLKAFALKHKARCEAK
jgi:hypothetical protein